jgi:hypothetical protein
VSRIMEMIGRVSLREAFWVYWFGYILIIKNIPYYTHDDINV